MSDAQPRIGMVGAGIMASGMVQNFLKHGHAVTVWNRTPEQLQPLVDAGAVKAESPKAVAVVSDMVIECVSDDAASRSVWTGEQGILAGARSGQVLIVASSLSLDWVDELAGLCRERQLSFLDMPLTGSRPGAEGGTLSLLIGGDPAVLEQVRPALDAISAKIFHFGPVGSGMRFKLLLNTLSAIHINAAAQAAAIAEAAGISREAFFGALFDGPMGPASPATQMLARGADLPADHVNFAVKWIAKDLRYAEAMAKKYGHNFDLLADTAQDYQRAADTDLGDQDWTKIAELYK